MSDGKPTIPLAQAIADLRKELLVALEEGRGKALQFKLQPVELELKLAITGSADAKAGVKFWVMELGAGGKYENATTHTLKLTLEPVGVDGGPVLISDTNSGNPLDEESSPKTRG